MTVQERNLLGSTLTPTGLDIPPDIGVDAWEELGQHLGVGEDAFRWAWGDWLLFGERAFGENRVAQAVEYTGRSKSALSKYRWQASKFSPDRRRSWPPVTWTHHEKVAALPAEEADRLLDEVVAHRWSVEELRGAVRPDKPQTVCTCVVDPECPKHGEGT